MNWEYKVAYVDFRGRMSIEGQEMVIEHGERRSAFVRTVLDGLGREGWELAGVHPLWPAETSYMIFKRPATSAGEADLPNPIAEHRPGAAAPTDSDTIDLGRNPAT